MLNRNKLLHFLNNKHSFQTISSLTVGGLCFLLTEQIELHKKPIILTAKNNEEIFKLRKLVQFYNPNVKIVALPEYDSFCYERTGISPEVITMRISAYKQMAEYQKDNIPFILITSFWGLLQKIRNPEIFVKNSVLAKKGKRVPIEKLSYFLTQNGYLRTQTVREQGEYAIRGGIFDIFPAGTKTPVRLDFWGEVIDSIKSFDPITQLSTEEISEFDLSPMREIILSPKIISQFQTNYRILWGGTIPIDDPIQEQVSKGNYIQGLELYLPLFDENLITVFDFLPDANLYLPHDYLSYLTSIWQEIDENYQQTKNHYAVPVPQDLYILENHFKESLSKRISLGYTVHNLPQDSKICDMECRLIPHLTNLRNNPELNLFDGLAGFIQKSIADNKRVLFHFHNQISGQRTQEAFKEHGIENISWIKSYNELTSNVSFCEIPLSESFETESLIAISENDIFGEKRRTKKRKISDVTRFLQETQSLSVGDYIVHNDHGIGRYLGLFAIEVQNIRHDCLLLEYLNGDKIYLPVENMDLLTRYAGSDANIALDKLGAASWQGRKAKLKEHILEMAQSLIDTAAARLLTPAPIAQPVEEFYELFQARFPYDETEDQQNAIASVLDDMASGHPMDRLVCGDVGFGKTEIAMRAAFFAACSGIQTALIVPTTLLARQHYRNFIERFAGQPFKIGRLSRMVPSKEALETKKGIKDGSVNIVIGTHALLAESVEFKNLGLLIIDEEQHFGVTHKEKLKKLRSHLHVLTLTATPIPRTLQMSMTGVRDLSLIATAPVDRMAIKTYVMSFDNVIVSQALKREKQRGGQSFFVVPRLSDLHDVSEFLKEYVPEISFVVAHGQMNPSDLDSVMNDFYDKKFDILVSTTIIESGIDIPSANTMIIWRADMFGLAQLYQIRGRIGRSKWRAYAYLTTPPRKKLTENAEKRLKILESLDSLGAGFTLASHDMDIRGAGNLLGSKQSGHIKEVGFELYQQMLEETLAVLKQEDTRKIFDEGNKSPQINIGISALIPENYIADLSTRISLYRRLSTLEDKLAIAEFEEELKDRFGKIPQEVYNLLSLLEVKNLCKKSSISKIDAGDRGLLLTFYKDNFPNPEKMLSWIKQKGELVKLRPDNKLAISMNLSELHKRQSKIIRILQDIVGLLD